MKMLHDIESRMMARATRDTQWEFMDRVARAGVLWFTPWNKSGRDEAADEWRDGLLCGIKILEWIQRHRHWFRVGPWCGDREARPIQLTRRGRKVLRKHRNEYDMEPVVGGLVDPGWSCIPLKPKRYS